MSVEKSERNGTTVEILTGEDARWDMTNEELEAEVSPDALEGIVALLRERDVFAEVWHSGGGVMGVKLNLRRGNTMFWGTAEDTWGADVSDPDGEYLGQVVTNIPVNQADAALAEAIHRGAEIADRIVTGKLHVGGKMQAFRDDRGVNRTVRVFKSRHGDWSVNLRASYGLTGSRGKGDDLWAKICGLGVEQSVEVPAPDRKAANTVMGRAHYIAATAGIAVTTRWKDGEAVSITRR